MIFLFYFPLLSRRSCILPVYLIAFCAFNKILLAYQKKSDIEVGNRASQGRVFAVPTQYEPNTIS